MRWSSPTLIVVMLLILSSAVETATARETCWFEPGKGRLICEESGSGTRTPVGTPAPAPRTGKQYVHVTTRPGVGECYYWSNTAGGVDAWDPANDSAVITIVTGTPECPRNNAPVVDVVAAAWAIFRSWPLDTPQVSLQPAGAGITGLPAYLATPTPASIIHSERLPDGRMLRVRAHVEHLDVAWGDGSVVRHQSARAVPFPNGAVTHTYLLKTCTDEYRSSHPSGGLCHPTLDRYRIAATFSWFAEYTTNGRWTELGTLSRAATLDYFVDEARGISIL